MLVIKSCQSMCKEGVHMSVTMCYTGSSFPGLPRFSSSVCIQYRAVGAGPAGPAAAGPIFGQLTHTKCLMRFGGLR